VCVNQSSQNARGVSYIVRKHMKGQKEKSKKNGRKIQRIKDLEK